MTSVAFAVLLGAIMKHVFKLPELLGLYPTATRFDVAKTFLAVFYVFSGMLIAGFLVRNVSHAFDELALAKENEDTSAAIM